MRGQFQAIAEKSIFVRRLGALSAEDQKAIRDRWNQQMRLLTKSPRRAGRAAVEPGRRKTNQSLLSCLMLDELLELLGQRRLLLPEGLVFLPQAGGLAGFIDSCADGGEEGGRD